MTDLVAYMTPNGMRERRGHLRPFHAVLGRTLFERGHKNPLRPTYGGAILANAINFARRVSGHVRLVTAAARKHRNIFDHDEARTATEALGYFLD